MPPALRKQAIVAQLIQPVEAAGEAKCPVPDESSVTGASSPKQEAAEDDFSLDTTTTKETTTIYEA